MPKYVDATICAVYTIYKEAVDSGTSIAVAKSVGDAKAVQKVIPKLNANDINEACHKLSEMGYLKKDVIGEITLKDDGITYMENRFKKGVKEVLEYVGSVLGFIRP